MNRAWFLALTAVAVVAAVVTLSERGSPPPASPVPRDAGPVRFQEGTAGARLAEYVAGDFAGERLERASWLKYKGWVMWPTEPGWDEAYVVRAYQLAKVSSTASEATAEVHYDTLGILNLTTFTYATSPSQQAVPFKLLLSEGAWKIGVPMLRPHPGPEATVAFLGRMREHYERQGPAIAQAIATIQADAARPAP